MGVLVVLILVFWVVLMALLTAWTIFFQGAIYTEPTQGVIWRGPAAGSAITLVAIIWVVFDYGAPGRYRPLWEFSSVEESKPFPEIKIGRDAYKLRPGSKTEYRLNGLPQGKGLPTRPPEVQVLDGETWVTFKAETDAKGVFVQRKTSGAFGETTEPLRYLDDKGRVLTEDNLGTISTFRGGWFFGNLFLNFFFLAACFLAFWLLLEFQWPHALGQAAVLWFVLLMFVFPPILSHAEQTSRERSALKAV